MFDAKYIFERIAFESTWRPYLQNVHYYIGFITIFERPCWGYMSHRFDFAKSWFLFIFRNIDFCDTSSVLTRFWFSQIAKGPIGGTEFWILARFLCVFWTRHEIQARLCPPMFEANGPGEGTFNHDLKSCNNPTTTPWLWQACAPTRLWAQGLGELSGAILASAVLS